MLPAKVRFISYEPAIGRIDYIEDDGVMPDWIIMGGESGASPRMMEPEWARYMRNICAGLAVPFFMKQMTGKAPIPDDLLVRQFPTQH